MQLPVLISVTVFKVAFKNMRLFFKVSLRSLFDTSDLAETPTLM